MTNPSPEQVRQARLTWWLHFDLCGTCWAMSDDPLHMTRLTLCHDGGTLFWRAFPTTPDVRHAITGMSSGRRFRAVDEVDDINSAYPVTGAGGTYYGGYEETWKAG